MASRKDLTVSTNTNGELHQEGRMEGKEEKKAALHADLQALGEHVCS